MKKLIEALGGEKHRYRVTIKGISGHLSGKFYYTTASSPDKALSNIVSRIMKEAQRPGSKMQHWAWQDGKVKIPMNPNNRGLLLSYLQANPQHVEIQRLMA